MMSRRNDVDDAGRKAPRRGRRGPQPRSRRSRHSLGQRVAAWTSVVLVGVLVAGALVAYAKYRSFWDSIRRVDVAGLIGPQPPKYTNAENILLIGSDTRVGQRGIGGQVGCNCSDTLMLLHISPGRHAVTVVNIPRETMVPILACAASDGTPGQTAQPGQLELINAALAFGGPACTWKTFEAVTDIHVDHFVQLDFTGFEKVINDLGGVNICLPFAIDDPQSGLNLSKGVHHVFGREALAFWRTREGVGEGSDLQRIQRDQFEMAALVQGIEHSGLLSSPSKMLKVVGDATDAMTTDTGLDQNSMLQIADSLRGVRSSAVQFVTAPNVPYPANINDVVFEQPQADTLFTAIAHDSTLPKPAKGKGKGKGKKAAAPPAVDTTTPSQVKVEVENGSGISLIASQAGSQLTHLGFNVVGTGDASNFNYTDSVIEYAGASDLPAANTLKSRLSSVQMVQDSTLTPGTVVLIVGSSFTSVSATPTPSPSSSASSGPSVASLGHAEGGITADTNICSNQSAFVGPDSPSG
jgi:LCP family protein required for cell wall assembly